MTWVRIDDQFTDHPKLASVGPVAGWVYVSGLCYAARYLTDGFVPETIALRFAGSSPELLENLVKCSLWDRVNGGYQIHDFLDYNPPASKVKAEREAAKERMKANRPPKNSGSPEVRQKFSRTSHEVQAPPSPSPSPIQRDEGLARPLASPPRQSQEPADPEWGAALSKLEALGMMTGSALLEMQALWPDLSNGRRAWIDDAITVAQANKANSPVYAIRVLANAVKTGKRPGETPQPVHRGSKGGVSKAEMDAIFGVDIHGNPV